MYGNLFLRHALAWITLFAPASSDLPPYTGPHGVGTIDLEIPVTPPLIITDTTFKDTGQPAFKLETVLFSLYYPSQKGVNSSKPHHFWLPRPIELIAEGLAVAAGGIDPKLIELGFNIIAGDLVIPAQVDSPLLEGETGYPVILFSHGDTSLSTWYSQYSGEMASRGYIVATIQHRDGSSAATQIMINGQPTRNVTAFAVEKLLPSMNATEFKLRQLAFREAELQETIKILRNISDGEGAAVFRNSSRGEGQDLVNWKSRIDFTHLIVAGHSLGSNLALQALKSAPSSDIPAAGSIVFDPGKDSGPLNLDVKVPILIADSEEWSGTPKDFYGKPHFDVVKSIAQGSLSKTNSSWFMTLLGTAHISITDAPLITNTFLNLFDNTAANFLTLDPRNALFQLVAASDEFLMHVVNNTRTGILASGITYPDFHLFPTPAIPVTPWEIHVAPPIKNSTSSGSKAVSAGTFQQYSWIWITLWVHRFML